MPETSIATPAQKKAGINPIIIIGVLFFVFGFVLILRMIGEWRRDVLHGPYVTREVPANDAGGTKTFTAPWSTMLEVSRAALSITRASLISASGLSPRQVALGGRYIVAFETADMKTAKRI